MDNSLLGLGDRSSVETALGTVGADNRVPELRSAREPMPEKNGATGEGGGNIAEEFAGITQPLDGPREDGNTEAVEREGGDSPSLRPSVPYAVPGIEKHGVEDSDDPVIGIATPSGSAEHEEASTVSDGMASTIDGVLPASATDDGREAGVAETSASGGHEVDEQGEPANSDPFASLEGQTSSGNEAEASQGYSEIENNLAGSVPQEELQGVPTELLDQIPRLSALAALVRQAVGFNSGRVVGVELTAVIDQMLDHQRLSDEHLDLIRAVFVTPTGYATLRSDVRDPGSIAVISGEAGSGRKTAAIHLLAELRRAGSSVRTLSYGGTSSFQARRMPRIDNCAFLLELPPDEDEFAVSSAFGGTLNDIAEILESTSSRLIVLTSTDQWQRVGSDSPVVARVLERPDAARVARAWLRLDLSEHMAHRWTSDTRIQTLLADQSPSAAMEMVELILQACKASLEDLPEIDSSTDSTAGTAGPTLEDDFNRRVLSVVSARKNWFSQLLKWHKEEGRTGFERNFLVVAAALRGAPIGHIYSQASALAQSIGGRQPELRGQDDVGVIQLVDSVDAYLDGDYVEFSKPGWDEAVLDYFWKDRPLAREGFLKWMAEAPLRSTTRGVKEFNAEERALLAERMAFFTLRWASRHGSPEILAKIVTAWHAEQPLWKAAVRLVTAAALHPVIGRETHRVLYNWATQGTDVSLHEAVADACSGQFGTSYPGKALVRLRHIATSANEDVIKAVRAALQNLWAEDSVRSTLFNEVVKWCRSGDEGRRAAGRRGFIALAELATEGGVSLPSLLAMHDSLDWTPTREDLATGWRAALDPLAEEHECRTALELWLNAALKDEETREVVIRVLRKAVEDDPQDTRQARPRHRLVDNLVVWQPPFPSTEEQRRRESLRREIEDAVHSDKARALDLLPAGTRGQVTRAHAEVTQDDQ
ncbi:hypothetical protein [Streptomyces abikoensis]